MKIIKKKIVEGFLLVCALSFTMLGIAGGHYASRTARVRYHESHGMKRKPENQVFRFGLEKVALKDLDIAQAHKANEYAHAMANGYGLNDDARMQNYWIRVENCVDAKICELERA